jgi:hypothetical protein
LTLATDRGAAAKTLAAFALLLAVVSAPLFSTVLPPLVDYPNHLARLQLIATGGDEFYAVRWAPLPDLAADLVVPVLARAMPLELAGKLFLVMSFTLLAGGTLWLNHVTSGRWRWWPLLAFALLYNRSLLWGFINYLFGLGVALCGVALWLSLDERRWLRVPVSAAVALGCFFSHFAAFGIYALAIAGVELLPVLSLIRARRYGNAGERIALAAVQFIVPAIIFLGFAPHASGGPISFAFWRKFDLLFSVFDNYSRPFDVGCFVLFVGLISALAWRRRLAIAPRLGIALAFVAAAYVLLPNQAFSGSGADHRVPVALFLLLIAATWPSAPLPRRAALAVGFAVTAVFAARMAVIEGLWLKSGAVYAAEIAVIDTLPRGAKLAVAFPTREVSAGGIPQLHVATLAAAWRAAFVPTVFAYAAQQPLALRPPYDALAAATSPALLWVAFVEGSAAALAEVAVTLRDYDFIVFAGRDPFTIAARPCLERLPSPPNFQLFTLRHDRNCF